MKNIDWDCITFSHKVYLHTLLIYSNFNQLFMFRVLFEITTKTMFCEWITSLYVIRLTFPLFGIWIWMKGNNYLGIMIEKIFKLSLLTRFCFARYNQILWNRLDKEYVLYKLCMPSCTACSRKRKQHCSARIVRDME